jgi:long-chain-fatty-acid--CoA ligase ACSBG
MRENNEVIVSYLPLSHIAANMLDIWIAISGKATVYFADKMALKVIIDFRLDPNCL